MNESDLNWLIATTCMGGACVEVAKRADRGQILVRDGKDRSGDVLVFGAVEWMSFLGAIKSGAVGG